MGRLEPAMSNARAGTAATAWVPSVLEACDRCGVSSADGNPISWARYAIKTPKGVLHFCAHHWRKNWQHFAERAYETTEL